MGVQGVSHRDAYTYFSEYGGALAEGIPRLAPVVEGRRSMSGELPARLACVFRDLLTKLSIERSLDLDHEPYTQENNRNSML